MKKTKRGWYVPPDIANRVRKIAFDRDMFESEVVEETLREHLPAIVPVGQTSQPPKRTKEARP